MPKHHIILPTPAPQDTARFWRKVHKGDDPDDCWEWQAYCNEGGYGTFKLKRQTVTASRLAYLLQHGEDPGEFEVCHTCDNPPCVRGSHLFKGTPADNMHDRDRKGRLPKGDRHYARCQPHRLARGDGHGSRLHPDRLKRGGEHWSHKRPEKVIRGDDHYTRRDPARIYNKGEHHHDAKLTAAVVRAARDRADKGEDVMTLAREYAARCAVAVNTMRRALRRQTWRHV